MTRAAVFTAVVGRYESLTDQPQARDSSLDWICLTDDPELTSTQWQLRVVPRHLPGDPVRDARRLKILAEPIWGQYERSLWIDNSVQLAVPPERLLDQWLAHDSFAAPIHSFRGGVNEEFQAVLDSGFDDASRVAEQLHSYCGAGVAEVDRQTLWTGILARRHTPEVRDLMRVWFDHVLRYSRRDQLSLPYCLARSTVSFLAVPMDNYSTIWHTWPVSANSRTDPGRRESLTLARPTAYLMSRLRQQAAAESQRNSALMEQCDDLISICASYREQVSRAQAMAAELRQSLDSLRQEQSEAHMALQDELREAYALRDRMLSSRRWRFAEGLRRPVARVRNLMS